MDVHEKQIQSILNIYTVYIMIIRPVWKNDNTEGSDSEELRGTFVDKEGHVIDIG